MLVSLVQLVRLRSYSLMANAKAAARRGATKCCSLNPVSAMFFIICLAAFFRAASLVFSNGLALASPALLILASLLPSFLEQCVFTYLVTGWIKLGFFSMNQAKQKKFAIVVKLMVFASFVVAFLFPLLSLPTQFQSESFQKLTLVSAYFSAATVIVLAIASLVGGFRLVSTLNQGGLSLLLCFCIFLCIHVVLCSSATKSQQSGGTVPKQSGNMQRRIRRLALILCLCFIVQAVFLILAVQNNHLYDETSNVVGSLAFRAIVIGGFHEFAFHYLSHRSSQLCTTPVTCSPSLR